MSRRHLRVAGVESGDASPHPRGGRRREPRGVPGIPPWDASRVATRETEEGAPSRQTVRSLVRNKEEGAIWVR